MKYKLNDRVKLNNPAFSYNGKEGIVISCFVSPYNNKNTYFVRIFCGKQVCKEEDIVKIK